MMMRTDDFNLNVRFHPQTPQIAFAAVSLLIILLLIYSNSFNCPWIFDDRVNIVDNTNVHVTSLTPEALKKSLRAIDEKGVSRPLAYLSFGLNHYFGGLNTRGYHAVNFLIHYLSAVFLFLFTYKTLNLPKLVPRFGSLSYSLALLSTFFWATSPLQVTAVTVIVQRMATMAGLFGLMSMYCYANARTASGLKRSLAWGFVSAACFAAGLASKQNAVLIPASIWLYDLLLLQDDSGNALRRQWPYLMTAAIIGSILFFHYVGFDFITNGYVDRPFTLAQRLMTQPRIILFYISLLVYPINPRLTFIHDIRLSTSLLQPWDTIPAMVILLGLIGCAIYSSKRNPLFSFCILFFFLNHSVESTFLPLELMFEHRNYVPSMLFFLPVSHGMLITIRYFSYKKQIQYAAAMVVTFCLAAQAHTVHVRNSLFQNPVFLWADNVSKAPELSRPYNNLGVAFLRQDMFDQAYEAFLKAKRTDHTTRLSNQAMAFYNLGNYYLFITSESTRALDCLESARAISPGFPGTYFSIALAHLLAKEYDKADQLLPKLSELAYTLQQHQQIGYICLKTGNIDRAIDEGLSIISKEPAYPNALALLGEAYRQKGVLPMAIHYWRIYRKMNPGDIEGIAALMALYASANEDQFISSLAGELMARKGTADWQSFLDSKFKEPGFRTHEPDLEKLKKIIDQCLKLQSQSMIFPNPCQTKSRRLVTIAGHLRTSNNKILTTFERQQKLIAVMVFSSF